MQIKYNCLYLSSKETKVCIAHTRVADAHGKFLRYFFLHRNRNERFKGVLQIEIHKYIQIHK